MIIDSSAIVAIVRGEPEADRFIETIGKARSRRVSAASYVEAAIVIDSERDAVVSRDFDEFLRKSDITVEPVTAQHAETARAAYRDFGKGSGHPARLNFGDCLTYAVAWSTDEALLYKGDDFGHTNLTPALPSE